MTVLIGLIAAMIIIVFVLLWNTVGLKKTVKIITLPVSVPIAFIVLGTVCTIAFTVMLFDSEKRYNLFKQ